MFWKKKKNKPFKCPQCGKAHDELPAIGFNEPYYYSILSEPNKTIQTELSSDFCIIKHPEQTDRFIRTYLRIHVNDACENLDYGVWVSVSEKTFNEYESEFKNNTEGKTYFGRIANEIEDYEESTLGLHVNIETRSGGIRPEIIPHESNHVLIKEWEQGISFKEAKKRIDRLFY